MYRKELNERNPLRLFEHSINGGLGRGNIGVVVARHGIGKTGFLVGIALYEAMRGRKDPARLARQDRRSLTRVLRRDLHGPRPFRAPRTFRRVARDGAKPHHPHLRGQDRSRSTSCATRSTSEGEMPTSIRPP